MSPSRPTVTRRQFLAQAGAAAAYTRLAHAAAPAPILDAHIHLFDPTRAGGVPWPPPQDAIYKPALPARYQALAKPLGIVGAIAIEASPLATDNDWLLHAVRASPFMVGMIGDLPPTTPDFAAQLDRLHRDELFLGIRHGNLWQRSLAADLAHPALWPALQHLHEAGLVLEAANPDPELLGAVLSVAQRLPTLTVVIDHLPHMDLTAPALSILEELAQAPHVYIKLSEIPVLEHGSLVRDPNAYRDKLDRLWSLFGPARVIFGSDWPNSDHIAPLEETLGIVAAYMAGKTEAERHGYYFANSQAAYRWRPRSASAP